MRSRHRNEYEVTLISWIRRCGLAVLIPAAFILVWGPGWLGLTFLQLGFMLCIAKKLRDVPTTILVVWLTSLAWITATHSAREALLMFLLGGIPIFLGWMLLPKPQPTE